MLHWSVWVTLCVLPFVYLGSLNSHEWLHMSSSYSFLELSSTSIAISFRRLCRAFRATPSSQVSSLPKSKNMPWGNLVAQGTTACLHNRDGLPWTCTPAKVCLNCFFQLHTTYICLRIESDRINKCDFATEDKCQPHWVHHSCVGW